MKIWRHGNITNNPYQRTAFRVTRVPREVTRRRTIAHLIMQTKRMVKADPRSHIVEGKPVTLAEINKAEAVVLDVRKRILEEMMAHGREIPPLQRLEELTRKALDMIQYERKAESKDLVNHKALRVVLQDLIQLYLNDVQAPEPCFGALELTLFPPFGPLKEEMHGI